MPVSSLQHAIPVDAIVDTTAPPVAYDPKQLREYVITCRNRLRDDRILKKSMWDECWQLYRGLEDWGDKEEWQSQMFIPKAWSSVKQATQAVKRLLLSSPKPWNLDAVNPDDLVATLRADQSTQLVRVFMDNARYIEAFGEGLECGFIMGLGIWKVWWGLVPRTRNRVVQPRPGQRQLVQEEILEGQLFVRAVDPYNFYWLPGSRLNAWVGTIEEIELPKWELMRLAAMGAFGPEGEALISKLSEGHLDTAQQQSHLRFNELRTGSRSKAVVKLTEYFGPFIDKDEHLLEPYGHMLIANDTETLIVERSKLLHRKAPYIGFSPLSLPFRTEGVGLIEMVRAVDRAINKLANMSVDTLLFKLLPTFEVVEEAFENPEDFKTGITPGKVFRRNATHMGMPGILPVPKDDVSQGVIAVEAQLDRAHQEGALVSEIQQALPRYRGVQTATEIELKDANQQTFFGSIAADIEDQALRPMVEMCWELIFQFIDTANDPRVGSILGVGADVFRGLSREEIQEAIQGDYKVRVSGITEQLEKAEMLQSLVQFMNIIGQNAQAWAPYINQSALLRRILEAFRPAVRDIEQIVAEPATVQAAKAAASQEAITPELLRLIPQLVDMATQQQKAAAEAQQAQQQQMVQLKMLQLDIAKKEADIKLTEAKARATASPHNSDN